MLWISVGLIFASTFVSVRAEEDAQATEVLWLADHAKLVHKVKTLVIGNVDLKDVTIDQAVDFLRRRGKISDPTQKGINFIFLKGDRPELKTFKFSVKLKNATVENILANIPNTGFEIGDFVVTLRVEYEGDLLTRTFSVRDNALPITPSMLIDKNKQTYDIRSLLEAKGVKLPQGDCAVYSLPAKTLTARFIDPENGVRIDEILIFGFKNVK